MLQSRIKANQVLIDALIVNKPAGWFADVQSLAAINYGFQQDIIPFETIIAGLNSDIVAYNTSKTTVQTKITLEEKCIAEITRYINDGTVFSADVAARLLILGHSI